MIPLLEGKQEEKEIDCATSWELRWKEFGFNLNMNNEEDGREKFSGLQYRWGSKKGKRNRKLNEFK